MGSKATNLFFVGIKTVPLGKEVRGAVSKWRISLEEEGKGGSATKGGALHCLCDRRQIRAGLWAVPANQE